MNPRDAGIVDMLEPETLPALVMHSPDAQASGVRPHVLVVDDDNEICDLLESYLSGHGYRISSAGNGVELRASLREQHVDLILLDLGLPGEDGLTLLRQFHDYWHGPVIVVSGRGETVERVVGLELGADDYVSKPFDLRELLARIRSVLRRAQTESPTTIHRAGQRIAFDGLALDVTTRRLIGRDGNDVGLTTGEFELLLALLEHANQVVTRDQLMNALHGRDAGPFDRTIDVQIGRLRKKIEVDLALPRLIQTVRGAGYMLAATISHA